MQRPYRNGLLLITLIVLTGALGWLRHGAEPDPRQPGQPQSSARAAVDKHAQAVTTPTMSARRDPPGSLPAPASATADRDAQACQESFNADLMRLRLDVDPDASAADAAAHALIGGMLELRQASDLTRLMAELEFATRRWPEDRALAWLRVNNCHAGNGCDEAAALAHLQRVDGENAVTWLATLAHAHETRDGDAFDATLRRGVDAALYASPEGVARAALQPALSRLEVDPACLRSLGDALPHPPSQQLFSAITASSIDAALSLPSYAAMSRCGDRDRVLAPHQRRLCRILLARAVSGEKTLLGRKIALSLLLQAGPDDEDGEDRRLREDYRRLSWLKAESFAWQQDPRTLQETLLLRLLEGEIGALQQIAESLGRWPPPDGWLPDNPRERALVLGTAVPDG